MVLDFEVFDDLKRMLAEAPYLFIGVMNDDGSQQEVLAVADNESDMSKFILEVWSQKPEEIKEKYKDTFIAYVGARHQFPFKAADLCDRLSKVMEMWAGIELVLNAPKEGGEK